MVLREMDVDLMILYQCSRGDRPVHRDSWFEPHQPVAVPAPGEGTTRGPPHTRWTTSVWPGLHWASGVAGGGGMKLEEDKKRDRFFHRNHIGK